MTDAFLFEHPHRGNRWRLEISTYRGRSFVNFRKWFPFGDGWKPSREGFTMPVEQLAELTCALMRHHGLEPPASIHSDT